jgi:formate-dependent nitrite reductase membrane component NrfD
MNLFVADPQWGWWIVLYFFLGSIAAGAYFTATLIDLAGRPEDHRLARLGYGIAFPLVLLCGLFLTVDLERPERFWHMLFKSEVVHQGIREGWPWSGAGWRTMASAPLMKHWSPMSAGAWALLIFGVCSFLSLLGSLWQDGRLARLFRFGFVGRVLQIIGCVVGFFIASYTGALLSATNEPLWSDSSWIAPLFLASATSTGIAALILLHHSGYPIAGETVTRLRRADLWALILELVVFTVFLASLGSFLMSVLRTHNGLLLLIGTLLLGILLPLGLHVFAGRGGPIAASVLALVGGFVLRYAILATPPELLAQAPDIAFRSSLSQAQAPVGTAGRVVLNNLSPEEGRARGGGPGADPGNKAGAMVPRSKVFDGD